MTEQERAEHRRQMRSLETERERAEYRRQHREPMKERVQGQGKVLPD